MADLMRQAGLVMGRLRRIRGLTGKEVGRRLKVSNVNVSYIEHGKRRPSPRLLEAFSREFGVDPYVAAWAAFGSDKNLSKEGRAAKLLLRRELFSGEPHQRSLRDST